MLIYNLIVGLILSNNQNKVIDHSRKAQNVNTFTDIWNPELVFYSKVIQRGRGDRKWKMEMIPFDLNILCSEGS